MSLPKPRLEMPDLWLVVSFVILSAVGWMTIYSASGGDFGSIARHSIHLLLAATCLFLVAQVDSEDIFVFSFPLYIVLCAALVLLLLPGDASGVRRWLQLGPISFQPSELMKLVLPMAIAWCLGRRRGKARVSDFIASLILLAVPVALVARQPDLGTAVVIAVAGCMALWVGGLSWRMLAALAVPMLALTPALWSTLHDYQRDRITYFLFPESDPLGAGYHVIQSTIAIGSGGVHGKGWRQGTQSSLDFLPERTTDFAFSVFCEEFGFVGFMFMLIVLLSLLYRGLVIAVNSPTAYGRILAASLCFVIATCAIINMGMTAGQLPVVGLPLPFVSMGGSALLTVGLSIGVLCSIQASARASARSGRL